MISLIFFDGIPFVCLQNMRSLFINSRSVEIAVFYAIVGIRCYVSEIRLNGEFC